MLIFISLYRSPSQSQDEFERCSGNLEKNLDDLLQNNLVVVLICHFNFKSINCHDQSSLDSDAVDNITKQYGLHQVIREPTHILDNTSSCVRLIFISKPNLTESGVHSSLNPHCNHHAKFNLHIFPSTLFTRSLALQRRQEWACKESS